MKVNTLRRQAWEALKAAGIADPVREADWLLAPALGLSLPKLLFEGDRAVAPLQAEQAWTFIRRRAAREPLQYLLATQEFCGLELAVTPDVLVPRPETELLVEATLQAVLDIGRPRVLDVGTGSGASPCRWRARAPTRRCARWTFRLPRWLSRRPTRFVTECAIVSSSSRPIC